MTLRPTSVLNHLLLCRTPLQTVFLNIRQKQSSIYRRRVCNPYEVVIGFSSSSTRSLLANTFFWSISFAIGENDQENSFPEVIYKSSDQKPDNGTNTKRTPLKEGL